jgi:hypothetical protein
LVLQIFGGRKKRIIAVGALIPLHTASIIFNDNQLLKENLKIFSPFFLFINLMS